MRRTAKVAADRPRILFFAEAVTLAHVARPLSLARALDPARYEVILACDPRYQSVLGPLPFKTRPLSSIPSARFTAALREGRPVYNAATLRAYVQEDLELMRALRPQLVVGDFRLSLAVSARLAQVPYFTITNAYWSPYARLRYPVPELPLVKLIGVRAAQKLFDLVRPAAFAYHARPLNQVRREYGLPSLGRDLRETYTHADRTLYADIPALVPTAALPPWHHWLGPILWSPETALPDWWCSVPHWKNVIYVTLGSSGNAKTLPTVLRALEPLPVAVMVAMAGAPAPDRVPDNVKIAPFLPGTEAARRSRLVICNGGSPTTQQALLAGVPVIGITGNLDQGINMLCVEEAQAGVGFRDGQLRVKPLRAAVERLLGDPYCRGGAQRLMRSARSYDAREIFTGLVAAQTGLQRN